MQIICLGDSITDCNHLFEDFPLGNGYVQILSEMFRNQTPSFSISANTVRRQCGQLKPRMLKIQPFWAYILDFLYKYLDISS